MALNALPRSRRLPRPGFGLTLGYALLYLSLLVLVPLGACVVKAAGMTGEEFWGGVTHPQAVAAYKLSFWTAFLAALLNAFFGLIVAWVLVRYDFWGKRLLDALVDIPLALPTAVAGLTFSSLYVPEGWFGQFLGFLEPEGTVGHFFGPHGWFGQNLWTIDTRLHDGPLAIVLVLMFVSLPFVIRSVQPVLAELEAEQEEAAASLGATRWQTFRYVILPALKPALFTGVALAFARCLGEYGSVIFVASNLPYQTEIPPTLIVAKLEQFKYAEAAAIATVLLGMSLVCLVAINLLERWSRKHD
jgi:sulfate transport system permease protein